MKRALRAVLVIGVFGASAGCNKPAAEDCRAAIANMQKLLGTDAAAKNGDNEGEVRRCKGGSSREAVACAMKASSVDELKACGFMAAKAKKE